MAEEILQDSLLIEGFDPQKLEELKQQATENKGWKKVYGAYQNDKILQADVVGIEEIGKMTCAIVMVEDVRGIIPMELFGVEYKRQLRNFVGRPAVFKVVKYDRENEIFTGSRVDARKQMAEITLRKIEADDVVPAVVNRVANHGLYADIGGIEVFIPIDQVRYGWIDDLTEEYGEGDHILVKILEINEKEVEVEADAQENGDEVEEKEIKKEKKVEVVVSAKAAQNNPWDGRAQRFLKGNEYTGVVSGVAEYGVFVRLADGIDSLARHLKFENVQKGDKVLVRVLDVDVQEEQIRSRIVRKL